MCGWTILRDICENDFEIDLYLLYNIWVEYWSLLQTLRFSNIEHLVLTGPDKFELFYCDITSFTFVRSIIKY